MPPEEMRARVQQSFPFAAQIVLRWNVAGDHVVEVIRFARQLVQGRFTGGHIGIEPDCFRPEVRAHGVPVPACSFEYFFVEPPDACNAHRSGKMAGKKRKAGRPGCRGKTGGGFAVAAFINDTFDIRQDARADKLRQNFRVCAIHQVKQGSLSVQFRIR
jgi:hypothetical protein